ncbi:outer membrane protein assembly factor BamB family protein [Planctomicrobium piriforme]|uniref:Pyrrolo-quinoline quinone repeat domain-containing protein n=1 Tax=Planctomicrobium piriforme TaxID=1576369 RepID=A0A1I3JHF3_9PLAN|nr:PQQ-binding-like beta-propeller repeat protein [Planctomicrobium piriforme]SFI59408.1 hypothetical protein SAMN05421753_110171 [Planctomicrobium piriforme]
MGCRQLGIIVVLIGLTGCERAPAKVEPVQSSEKLGPQPVVPITTSETDWPVWRGSDQKGTAADQPIPVKWSETENLIWQAEVPGRGHSSPIRCGPAVYLATADEGQQTQSVVAYDFATGKQLWETVLHRGHFTGIHPKNSHASATVCCDGTNVYAAFINGDKLWATALDPSGKQLWQTEVGPFNSEHGYGASPTLYGSVLILSGDSIGTGYLAAVNRGTGDVVWRTPRQVESTNGSYASPIVTELAGRTQVLLAGFNHVTGYDPETGKQLWQVSGPSRVLGNTLAASDPYVIASGGYPEQNILGIKIDNPDQVSDANIVWKKSKNVAYVPSPVVVDDRVLILADDGPLACYEIASGDLKWQRRLPGSFTASLTRVGKLFLVPNEQGEMIVFEVDPEFKILSKNKLSDAGGMATPAVCEGRILIRSDHRLFCIGEK